MNSITNKFLELASSPLMNLDHTYRYSGTKLVESESLSQHIVDTIMMGLKVINDINHLNEIPILSANEYVMKAVYHDLEEVITGDIPRPLKYYNKSTTASMKEVADSVAKGFFDSEFNDGEDHYWIWDHAKDGSAGYILKIVDTLVVANKVVKEVDMLGNMYMLKVAHEVSQYLKELVTYNVDKGPFVGAPMTYIDTLLEDAIKAMEDILRRHETVVNNMGILGQSMI